MRDLLRIPCCIVFAVLFVSVIASAQTTPTLSVDVSTNRYPISPYIYGLANGVSNSLAQQLALPVVRWGGDGTTRYNWQFDSSNAGYDWYFMSGSGSTNPVPGASADAMITANQPGTSLITIPIIPYINDSAAWNCSFPVAVYGAQQSTNPYVFVNNGACGNSIAPNGTTQLSDTDIYSNNLDNTPALQQGWVQHIVNTFGAASTGGVQFYQLDNEPFGWGNTHRDVEPNGTTYPTIASLGQQYAAVVKAVDPSANVLGPSDFTLGGWIGDMSQQNNEFAGVYYLQQMAAYQQQNNTRILDYFDEHYYFQFSDAASQLASTRTLWDPTYNGGTWVEQWYFDGPMQLIPRFQSWITQYYPGTKVSLSEYSIDSGSKSIVDAIAEMDVLGIFGRQQLDLACMWSPPAPTDPIAYSFRMFRNYDGNGSQYGDIWINAASTDQTQLSVYAAQRTSDSMVTILVINKTTAAVNTTLALSGANLPTTAAIYSYTGTNLTQIVSGQNAPITNGAITYNFPSYSATLFTFLPIAAPAATTTTLTASPQGATVGQPVTLTATINKTSGMASPGGSVIFYYGSMALRNAPVNSGVATYTASTNGLPVNNYGISAKYSGDSNYLASTSSTTTVALGAAPTATALALSSNSVTPPASVTLTATVTRTAAGVVGTPAKTVTFFYENFALGSATLNNGVATFAASSAGIPGGNYAITARYNGDSDDEQSTSTPVVVTVQ